MQAKKDEHTFGIHPKVEQSPDKLKRLHTTPKVIIEDAVSEG